MSAARGTWISGIVAVVAAAIVAGAQGRSAELHRRLKENSDVWLLPEPQTTRLLSLGHHSALADYLWADLLVKQGLRSFQKRRFDNLERMFDTIIELDPKFRPPYAMADAIITFQVDLQRDDLLLARRIMERGVRELPNDAGLWLTLGSFVGFIAPAGMLKDPAEQERWRLEAAPYLARAAELGGSDANVSWQALGGAKYYFKAGQRDATIAFYRRILAVTDDEELRQRAQASLAGLLSESERDALEMRNARFEQLWRTDLPFVSRTTRIVLGPPWEPEACAGKIGRELECHLTWASWGEYLQNR